jgi:hypothetical protein
MLKSLAFPLKIYKTTLVNKGKLIVLTDANLTLGINTSFKN